VVRDRAIRELDATNSNDAFLKDVYRSISETSLRDRIIRALGASRGEPNVSWIRGVVTDRSELRQLRDRALRVLGEEMNRRAEVRALYPSLDDSALKDRALRIVAAGGDSDGQWLREVALNPREPIEARDRAIRLMAEANGPDANEWLESLVTDRSQPLALRDRAVRVLAERGRTEFLKQAYPRLEAAELKDRVIRSVAEANAVDAQSWLAGIAQDASEADAPRDRAVRVLAERGAPTAELANLYDRIQTASIRQRLVRVLVERNDDAAVEKLIAIADGDPDPAMRRYVVRRLAETKSPKARSFLEKKVR
jgi:SOS response regulatory protein OraA/RecX